MISIANSEARRLFLHSHGLSADPGAASTAADIDELVEQLGFVQVDSIRTVERAHHQILFSRRQTYRQNQLARLIERERTLFENWTHDASIIPSQYFPYWRHRFERQKANLPQVWKRWGREGFDQILDEVRDRIETDGPKKARDWKSDRPKSGGGWWEWHPAKTALEYLWHTGELAICHRDGFQKVYDLAHRVIPPDHYEHRVSETEMIDWSCSGALSRLGFATHGELAAFWDLVSPAQASRWVEAQRNDLVEVEVETAGDKPRRAWARPDIVERLAEAPDPPGRLRLISPFDPVLRDRARLERLFGFNYRIEIFVPEAKRKYGYYVFPILEGDRFIGRIDLKAEREVDRLTVRRLWLEPRVRPAKSRFARLESELARVARFCGVSNVVLKDGALPSG